MRPMDGHTSGKRRVDGVAQDVIITAGLFAHVEVDWVPAGVSMLPHVTEFRKLDFNSVETFEGLVEKRRVNISGRKACMYKPK